jgi:hypothetical protein
VLTSRGYRKILVLLSPVVLSVAVVLGLSAPAQALPGNIPTTAAAETQLGELTVAANGSIDGYSRDEFPTWITIEGTCNTREEVLKRDGDDVTVGSDCYPTDGSWTSPYNDSTTSTPSSVQIDHIVPLADAWMTGASAWTTAQRQAFANDLTDPQLLAADASSNESKGDRSPDEWKPADEAFWCTYAKMYTHVKYVFSLTVTSPEKDALGDMLGTC